MAHVMILGTGGTISSRASGPGAGLEATDSPSDMARGLNPAIEVRAVDVLRTLSFMLTFADLRVLHEAVQRAVADEDCVGVVITHGTDTMEETAFLLDLLHDSDKPVVITGAQRSADAAEPDGPGNLAQAILAASAPELRTCGVLICFAGTLRSARGARKVQTWELDAFDGGVEVARVVEGHLEMLARPPRRDALPGLPQRFDEVRVEVIPCFLGATPGLLNCAIDQRVDGIVLAGTGIGNAGAGFVDGIRRCGELGIPVVLSSRVQWGPTRPLYGQGGGVDLVGAGAIPSGELGPYQSRILMAVLLAEGVSDHTFCAQFLSHN